MYPTLISFCLFFVQLLINIQTSYSQIRKEIVQNKNINILRSDGIYNTYDTSLMRCGERVNKHYYTYNHVIIINSSKIFIVNGMGSYDDYFLKYEAYKNLKLPVGNYRVSNDTLHVKNLPIMLTIWGGRLRPFYANFEGVIKNADTILNWRMVKPYPKVNMQLNDDLVFERTPKLLYFIKSNELLKLDSLYQKQQEDLKGQKNNRRK